MNILAERSFPSFFKDSHPKLLKFFSDWLDWTEQPENVQYLLNNLSTEQDIDESVRAYRTHLKAKLLADFPEKTAVKLRLLLKTVLWLYRAKSSRKAYDFLFRVLFNSPARIWHPRDTMLKTSDGRWDVPQYCGISLPSADADETVGAAIRFAGEHLGWKAEGQSSGAIGFISGAAPYTGTGECLSSSLKELGWVKLYEPFGEGRRLLFDTADEFSPRDANGITNDGIVGTLQCDPLVKTYRVSLNKASANANLEAEFCVNGVQRKIVFPKGKTEAFIGAGRFSDVPVDIYSAIGKTEECLESEPKRRFLAVRSSILNAVGLLERQPGGDWKPYVPEQSNLTAIIRDADEDIVVPLVKNSTALCFNPKSSNPQWFDSSCVVAAKRIVTVETTLISKSKTNRYATKTDYTLQETIDWLNPSADDPIVRKTTISGSITDNGIKTEKDSVTEELPNQNAATPWKARMVIRGSNGTSDTASAFGFYGELLHLDDKDGVSYVPFTGVPAKIVDEETVNYASSTGMVQKKVRTTTVYELTAEINGIAMKAELAAGKPVCYFGYPLLQMPKEANVVLNLHERQTEMVHGRLVYAYDLDIGQSDVKAVVDYDFELEQYVARLMSFSRETLKWSPLQAPSDWTLSFSFNGESFKIAFPEGKTFVSLSGRTLKPPVVTAWIKAAEGIAVDAASKHFAPGELMQVSDVNSPAVSETVPTVLWHAEGPGHYTETRGFLSDINAVQDNHYWQNYSYVVQSYVGIREWRRIVRRILHPAGLIFFGEVLLEGALEPGSGIMKMPDWQFLKRLDIFFKRMASLARQAVLQSQMKLASCRLAQTHSITSDTWLHWINAKEEADTRTYIVRRMLERNVLDADEAAEALLVLQEEAERNPDFPDPALLVQRCYGRKLTSAERTMLQGCAEGYANCGLARQAELLGRVLTQKWLSGDEKAEISYLFQNIERDAVHFLGEGAADSFIGIDLLLDECFGRTFSDAERDALQALVNRIDSEAAIPWREDLRDWFDIRPADMDQLMNCNSVLMFRNDGTLIDPEIVDWVDFSFKDDIDLPFVFKGETVAPHTKSILGTTLHPDHPMIHGRLAGNELKVTDDQEFIPNRHLLFAGATKPSNGMIVKYLNVRNEVLQYTDVARIDSYITDEEGNVVPSIVSDLTVDDLARKLSFQLHEASETGIVEWRELLLKDFIAVPTDTALPFNINSLVKVPDAWVTAVPEEFKYVMDRKAWDDEKGVVVSYSPFDFSYRLWLERDNLGIVCKFTIFNSERTMTAEQLADKDYLKEQCPLQNANVQIDSASSVKELIAEVPSGFCGPVQQVYAVHNEWRMSFKDVNRQSSWFTFKLPEVVSGDRVLCFVNGLLSFDMNLDEANGLISVDTVKDNRKITYRTNEWLLGELSLEEWVFGSDGKTHLTNPDGSWKTRLVMVSISESESIPFGEATLQDSFLVGSEMVPMNFGEMTVGTLVEDILACVVSSSLSYSEIYVLSPIEASRKLKYPWYGWKIEADWNSDGNADVDSEGNPLYAWPFTYDNARLFPFAAHGIDVTCRSTAEVVPDSSHTIHSVEKQISCGEGIESFAVEVPTVFGISVYVDGVKLPDGEGIEASFERRVTRDGELWKQAPMLYEQDIPRDGFLQYFVVLDCDQYADGRKHSVRIEWLTPKEDRFIKTAQVQWRKVRELQADFAHHFTAHSVHVVQKQSETVDRILATWWSHQEPTGTAAETTWWGAAPNCVHLDFAKNANWTAASNASSTLLFGEDGILVSPSGFNWSECTGGGGKDLGVPLKWWSVPIQADLPMESGTVASGRLASSADVFKKSNALVFVEGSKILDTDVGKSGNAYSVGAAYNGKTADVFSLGSGWMMTGTGQVNGRNAVLAGYFNVKKTSSGWVESTLSKDASSASAAFSAASKSFDGVPTEFDLLQYVGISMGRDAGAIWPKDGSGFEYIKGTTEIVWKNGDKRRFVDLTFMQAVNVMRYEDRLDETLRLYEVVNYRPFGTVDRIADIDPRYLMVFIDGKYAPYGTGRWTYLKGSLFISETPEQSVEVYIGSQLSYLMPDSAYAAPSGIGDLVFNNLRINPVPRHHLTVIDRKEYRLPLLMRHRFEVDWRRMFRAGLSGWFRKNQIVRVQPVQKQSETFDDILYWRQMSPNAWLDVDDPMKLSNKSSLLVFDAQGHLVDPIRLDWHKKVLAPSPSGDPVEILTPVSHLYTGQIYFPAWEYDQTEDKSLHTALYVLDDGRTEGRYRDLVESNWNVVYINGQAYDYDQWFRKQFADLHLEETVWVNEYPTQKPGENLLLTDRPLDMVQEDGTLQGALNAFQIEALRQGVRSVVLGSRNMDLAVEVPSVFGAQVTVNGTVKVLEPMVFVDGVKLPEGSIVKRITLDGASYRQGTNLQPSVLPASGDIRQYFVLDGAKYGDSTEHTVAVYYPAAEYGSSIRDGNLCQRLYENSVDVLWEMIWNASCIETYDVPELQASLTKLLSSSGFAPAVRRWLALGNGSTFRAHLGLNANSTPAQIAKAVADAKPTALPEFLRSLKTVLTHDELIDLYKVFAKKTMFKSSLVEQFREYVKNRFLLFADGIQIPVTVDSTGRIAVEIGGKHVMAEDFSPASFELYCIDQSNPVLKSSRNYTSEQYQSLQFQNLRIFPYVETVTQTRNRKTYDWKIQYFIRNTRFKTSADIYMNQIGFERTSDVAGIRRVNCVSETIDEVLARQQMHPSAWSGLDFDIIAKASRNSVIVFTEGGEMVDPLDIDFFSGEFNPKSSGTVIEVYTPQMGLQTARIYWPIYAVDQEAHSAPFDEDAELLASRYAELHESSFEIAHVGSQTVDIDRYFRKEAGHLHLEETIHALARPDETFPLGIYAKLLEAASWDPVHNVKIDAERLLLTDIPCDSVVETGGSATAVAIDAERPIVREVQITQQGTPFRTFVPTLAGMLVFVDGIKQKEDRVWKQAWVGGRVAYDSTSLSLSGVPANATAYSIEIKDDSLKDGKEHTTVVYYPANSWAARVAAGSPAAAIASHMDSRWREYGFDTFSDWAQSRFILFCDGRLQAVSGYADGTVLVNGEPASSYRCSDFELYVVDLSNPDCRVSDSTAAEFQQAFTFDNAQKNWFMEHHGRLSWIKELQLKSQMLHSDIQLHTVETAFMPVPNAIDDGMAIESWTYTVNNRDTLDCVFVRGSIPVRAFVNPSLYVMRTTKIDVAGLNDYEWKTPAPNESVDDVEWVALDAVHLEEDGTSTVLGLTSMDSIVDGKVIYTSMYVPETWDIQIYATDRENPEAFWPCEKVDSSSWRFYSGWNQRLIFFDIQAGKDVYVVETLDRSMEGSIANTDWVFWLEKEFNKKSTLVLDNEGLLVHPEGLEWCDGGYAFPHEGTWAAQPQEAKFPAVLNELLPDNIKRAQVMELCLNDRVGYSDSIAPVADANLDSIVAVTARTMFKKPWSAIANRDYIFWEEGEFRNWNGWLLEDDVFIEDCCFVFVNGFKIPDGIWLWHSDRLMLEIPLYEEHLIPRFQFAKPDARLDEWIWLANIRLGLIEDEEMPVREYAESNGCQLFIDTDWATWKDKDGFPVMGPPNEIPEGAEVLILHPDPREGVIWPVDRIRHRFYTEEVKAKRGVLNVPEYLGHDLALYVQAFVNCRRVQCSFAGDGTKIIVPGWQDASVIEVYAFELHDGAWIDRFNADSPVLNLRSIRDMKVC